jgi:hypothetical protein
MERWLPLSLVHLGAIGASKADSRRKGGSKEPKNKEKPGARDRK